MKKTYLLLLTILFYADLFGAPLNHNVQFPTLFMFMAPKAETPEIVDNFKASVSLDHTSIHVNKTSSNFEVLMDMEYTVLTPTLEYNIFHDASVSIEIPVISMNDGFLDRPLADYHDAGNFGDYGRSLRPHNDFGYYIKQNNQDWFIAKKGSAHILDTTASIKYIVYRDENLLCAATYKVKMPTGNYKYGFGSGKFDHGFFMLTRYSMDDIIFYLNPGLILIEDPKTIGADIKTNSVYSLFTAIEYKYSKKLSIIVQLNSFTNHINGSDINNFENDTVEGTIGFSYVIAESVRFEFSFSEDLTYIASAPDFTFQTGLVMGFGK